MNAAHQQEAKREGKYLTFTLAGEEYGIGILKIREIIGLMPITTVPETPHYVKGVINLRGKVIPVVDMRQRFGLPQIDCTERTCIVVVEIPGPGGVVPVGNIVDSVSEVLNIREADIEDPPTFGTSFKTAYILGMAKTGKGVKILLDIEKALSSEEMQSVSLAA